MNKHVIEVYNGETLSIYYVSSSHVAMISCIFGVVSRWLFKQNWMTQISME